MSPNAFLLSNVGTPGTFGYARFIKVEETPYLVLLVLYPGEMMPGDTGAGFLLLHPDGRAMDAVQMRCSTRQALLHPVLIEKQGNDGAQLAVLPSAGLFLKDLEPTVSYRLHQWRKSPREGTAPATGSPERDGICRLKIAGGRFEILSPK